MSKNDVTLSTTDLGSLALRRLLSAIFGIVRFDGKDVFADDLKELSGPLGHRGPDGIEYFCRGNIGFGHAMLHSTPESLHESLPFRDGLSGLTITADVRLDNREELIKSLPLSASGDKVLTDGQLILHAFRKWRDSCVEHLLGDFSFAIWDEEKRRLFCARDHIGCKPFYYHMGHRDC